jgi:hypothetical protein
MPDQVRHDSNCKPIVETLHWHNKVPLFRGILDSSKKSPRPPFRKGGRIVLRLIQRIKQGRNYYLCGSMITLIESLASATNLKPLPVSARLSRCEIISLTRTRRARMSSRAVT